MRDLKESDLVSHKWNPSKYLQYLSPEEVARMKEVFRIHRIDPNNAFGRWIVYERDEDADSIVGPEKFSLLYIAGDERQGEVIYHEWVRTCKVPHFVPLALQSSTPVFRRDERWKVDVNVAIERDEV